MAATETTNATETTMTTISTSLVPTIATFVTYDADGAEVFTDVTSASVSISGKGGAWGVKVVISLRVERFGREQFAGFFPGGRHFRYTNNKTYRTRALAKGAAQTVLQDHLGHSFTGATVRINGRDKGAL